MRLNRILCCLTLAVAAVALAVPAQAEPPVQEEGPVMVWQLPDSYTATGPVALEVEVLKDGKPLFAEAASLDLLGIQGTRAIEVLAGSPEARSLATTLVERGNTIMEVVIRLDGEEMARLPLSTVIASGEANLQDLQFVPLHYTQADSKPASEPGVSFITAAGTDCTDRNACIDQCWSDYYSCVEYFCESEDPQPHEPVRILPEDCDFCTQERFDCQIACPPCECVDPKSVTYSTSSTVVDSTIIGWECAEDWNTYDDWGYQWDYYQRLYKVTTYKHTEACDGTVTTTVDSVDYQYSYCWDTYYFSCYWPNPYASTYPRCY